MNFLFTAGGRRVEIINIFKSELPRDTMIVADISGTAPALYSGHEALVIPKFSDPQCLKKLLEICREKKIDAIIPLTDYEIDFYSGKEKLFKKAGACILLSAPKVVNIARDKWKTHLFFRKHGIPAANTVLRPHQLKTFPAIAKPVKGSAGAGVVRLERAKDLAGRRDIGQGHIFQRWLEGEEITVDVLTDGSGECLGQAQRLRLKVRAGEVERAVTVFDAAIDRQVRAIVRLLKPFGMINIQLFKTAEGELFFQEINLRLGGGCPLSYQAGINIPQIIKQIVNGKAKAAKNILAREGIYMLRFDTSLYLTKEQMVHG